jgi:DNA repair photolyase
MKVYPQNNIRLDETEFKENMGSGNFIFVGSSTDMWSDNIPREWIERIIAHCMVYPHNIYLYQTKNPLRYTEFAKPPKFVLGTTIETNREDLVKLHSKAPTIENRVYWMMQLPNLTRKMITIEPIMDFDLVELVNIIHNIRPEWVNVGADSKGHKLPEPSAEKVNALIKELKTFTEVKIKDNLKRLTGGLLPSNGSV